MEDEFIIVDKNCCQVYRIIQALELRL